MSQDITRSGLKKKRERNKLGQSTQIERSSILLLRDLKSISPPVSHWRLKKTQYTPTPIEK